ncbi:MAG: hypothetical protein PWQ59_676 [Thermoanaerobacterium sp.]|jgi:hypothetical protein|nr:hypothetical protein [Thermoanaerobacterium sp.]
MRNSNKGTITVEASIVLPIFICAILTIGFLTKVVYVHEKIQNVINESANELACFAYLSNKSVEGIKGSLKDLNKTGLTFIDDAIEEGFDKALEFVNDKFSDDVVKYLVKIHLEDNGVDINQMEKSLHVVGGFEGLDFSGSSLLVGDDIDIKVRYKLDIPFPFKFVDKISIVQRACAKAWKDGK